jgi:hypothetical protein
MNEDTLLSFVMDEAHARQWRFYHALPAMNVRGRWLTAYKGDGGLPDCIMARDGQFIAAELKDAKGKYRPGQAEWAEAFGEHHRLWRPSDIGEIRRALR